MSLPIIENKQQQQSPLLLPARETESELIVPRHKTSRKVIASYFSEAGTGVVSEYLQGTRTVKYSILTLDPYSSIAETIYRFKTLQGSPERFYKTGTRERSFIEETHVVVRFRNYCWDALLVSSSNFQSTFQKRSLAQSTNSKPPSTEYPLVDYKPVLTSSTLAYSI